MLVELRLALRRLLRAPAFSGLAVLTLALGIGSAITVYSVVDAVLLRPLPYPTPERLVMLWGVEPATGTTQAATSYPDFLDYAGRTHSFADMAAWRTEPVTLAAPGIDAMRLTAAPVSRTLFTLLGVAPRGRGFTQEEDRPKGAPAVVLSHATAERLWGAREDIVGQAVTIDGVSHPVVGILPAGFQFLDDADIYLPLGRELRNEIRGMHSLLVVGRLADGATLSAAEADVAGTAQRLAVEYPREAAGRTAHLEPLHESVVGPTRLGLLVLSGAVAILLLIACANVAGLLLARGASHEREMAVRLSLGAARAHLLRQALVESALLALLGFALGLLLARGGVSGLLALAPQDLPRRAAVAIDLRVALAGLAMTLGTVLVFGVGPAFASTRSDPARALQTGTRGSAGPARRRLRRVLVVAETALAVVLLSGCGLLLRSLWQLHAVDPGFEPRGVLTAELALPEPRYPGWKDSLAFYDVLLQRLRALPGVSSAAVAAGTPFGRTWGSQFAIDGRPPFPSDASPEPSMRIVSGEYFRAAGVSVLRGRAIDERDRPGTPGAVVVNQAFVHKFFPDEDALGRRLLRPSWWPELPGEWEIVGVVADTRTGSLDAEAQDAIYYPFAQCPIGRMRLLLRTQGDPAALATALQAAVRSSDPQLALGQIATLEAIMSEASGSRRFQLLLLGTFAALAMALAGIGLYGVLALGVAQRTREIGVRRALGAGTRQVLALVASESAGMAGAGLVIGSVLSLAVSHSVASLLYGVQPGDPPTLLATSALLAIVTGTATVAPLYRALRVEPAVALRDE